jgi:hypothetical protein
MKKLYNQAYNNNKILSYHLKVRKADTGLKQSHVALRHSLFALLSKSSLHRWNTHEISNIGIDGSGFFGIGYDIRKRFYLVEYVFELNQITPYV